MTVATLLTTAAAMVPWPRPDLRVGELGRIDVLAPRGRMNAPPTAICWTTELAASRLRVGVRDAEGRLLFERVEDVAPGSRALVLTGEERNWFAAARAGSVRLDAVSQDGELLGGSLPAQWSLPARSSSDDK